MPDHPARFPGVTNDPAKHTFTARQAARLAALTHVPATDSQTAAVNLAIDATPPSIEFLDLLWRHPDVSLGWQSLPLTSSTECPVIHRASNARIQIHLSLRVSADHLRSFTVTPVGCGALAAAPQLITDGRNGLPRSPPPPRPVAELQRAVARW